MWLALPPPWSVSRSVILDFHGVLIQSLCEGQEAQEEREQLGPSSAYGHFQNQDVPFGQEFADILLREAKSAAAKRFTLVVKHRPFFPRVTGKLVYRLASLFVLLEKKNQLKLLSNYFTAVHIKFESLQRMDFQKPRPLLLHFREIAVYAELCLAGVITRMRSVLCCFKILISPGRVRLKESMSP